MRRPSTTDPNTEDIGPNRASKDPTLFERFKQDKPLPEIEVYDILYEDCNTIWVFCRHKNAESDIETAAETFGKVAVRIRDWTEHVILFPTLDDGLDA
ncbi:hypothetical protein BDV12DRAFT_204629 [Aspergillus spectabilis]